MGAWVILSTEWKLQDVQAGLVIVISVLCALTIFTSARFFWQSSAVRLARKDDVPLSSLLSFTTLGEVLDVIALLKVRIFTLRYLRLFLQCLVVIIFTLAAILSGVISRFSTRIGTVALLEPTDGMMASRGFACDINDVVRWQTVMDRLNAANFPRDQLLDWLPDNNVNWTYKAGDWNSTFAMNCTSTPKTDLFNLRANQDKVNATHIRDEIPGLDAVLSQRFLKKYWTFEIKYSGTQHPSLKNWDNVIMWFFTTIQPDSINSLAHNMSFSIASIYMENLPMTTTKTQYFGKGPIGKSFYTKVECDITRRPGTNYTYYEAYPDVSSTVSCLGDGLANHYFQRSARPYPNGTWQVNLPSGDELIRWYQAYTIIKDTYYPVPVQRMTSVLVPTVELAVAFVVLTSITLLIVGYGLARVAIFYLYYRKHTAAVPETKVDWILQSLQEAHSPEEGSMMDDSYETNVLDKRASSAFALGRNNALASAKYGSKAKGADPSERKAFGKVRTSSVPSLQGDGASNKSLRGVPSNNSLYSAVSPEDAQAANISTFSPPISSQSAAFIPQQPYRSPPESYAMEDYMNHFSYHQPMSNYSPLASPPPPDTSYYGSAGKYQRL